MLKRCFCARSRPLAISIIILISFCWYFQYSFSLFEKSLFNQQFESCKFHIDTICNAIDYAIEQDLDTRKARYTRTLTHQTILKYMVEQIDKEEGIYCQLFDAKLNPLSERFLTNTSYQFELPDREDVIERIRENSGCIETGNTGDRSGRYLTHIYWRWSPKNSADEDGLLFVTGITSQSVNTHSIDKIAYGAFILIIVSAIFIVTSIAAVMANYGLDNRKG